MHTYIYIGIPPPPISCNNIEINERRLYFPGEGDKVCSTRVLRVRYDQELSRLIWLSWVRGYILTRTFVYNSDRYNNKKRKNLLQLNTDRVGGKKKKALNGSVKIQEKGSLSR